MKTLLSALKRSGTKQLTGRKTGPEDGYLDENDSSPLAPRRLLSTTPESRGPARQLRSFNNAAIPTPKVLAGEKQTPGVRLQRDSGLRFTAQKPAAAARQQLLAGEGTPSLRPARLAQEPQLDAELARLDAHSRDEGAVAEQPAQAGAGDNIKVIVRVRPANERERGLGGSVCVHPVSATTLRVASTPEPHTFTFDHVAQQGASQESVFRAAGRHVVENCLHGYNGCIFAYGQTGSGKTFTMLGIGDTTDSLHESRGLIQRVFEHLFMRIREKQEQAQGSGESCKYMLRCSMLEIYNEAITDLLNPGASNLAIREDIRKGCYVEGLAEEECRTVEDVVRLLQQGIANRRVGETNMNDKSSRSHCVFTCTLESKTTGAGGATNILFSRLHLVDLAGSERQKASGAQGERLREASSINKSLSTLGHVISSLVDLQSGRARHVPYRDSRLTFLLQDSLGGNAKACLVATISPATCNMAETLSTLRFADNTKRIKNKAVVNEDTNGEAAALKREIKRLREELARVREQGMPGQHQEGGDPELPWGRPDAGFGSPLRMPTLSTISGSPLMGSPIASPSHQGTRRALVAALRREEAAARQVARLEAELQELSDLLKLKDADLQRQQMIGKLKEARLARLQGGEDSVDARMQELQQEVELLRSKIDSHPEVRRFAAENLHLAQEVERLRELVDRNELHSLHRDIGGLRGEMLAMADALERAQEEAVVQQALAESFKVESSMAADQMRSRAIADKEAEVSRLEAQLSKEREQLKAASAANARLQQEVGSLRTTVHQLESAAGELRAELSPVRRKASCFEQQLDLVRQESSAAMLRASSELTLRSQVEVAAQQLQQKLQEVETDCAQLRQSNEELQQARAGAEEGWASQLSSLQRECSGLQAQLEQERAVAAERQADHREALQQLDSMRKRIGGLEQDCAGLQRELHEAQEALARQRDEHEAAQSTAAERIAAALRGAQDMQRALESKETREQELQHAVDALTKQQHQLEQQKKHVECQLAQRDNELQDVGQSLEDLELTAAKYREELALATVEVERLKADLAGQEQAAQTAAERVEALTAQLEAAADQLPEREAQLLLAKAEVKDLRQQLLEKDDALAAAQTQLAAKEGDLAALRTEMASEVAAAALQVQQLLGAQAEAESLRAQLELAQREQQRAAEDLAQGQEAAQQQLGSLQERLAESEAALAGLEALRQAEGEQARTAAQEELRQLQGQVGELQQRLDAAGAEVAEVRAQEAAWRTAESRLQETLREREQEVQLLRDELEASVAARTAGADQSEIQAQLAELVAEREAWIEEMHQQRVAARATADAAGALECRLAEVAEAKAQLEVGLAAAKERESKLEQEVTALTGHSNLAQKIQYHKKVKEENSALKDEVNKLRIDLNIISVRYDRAKAELARFRSAAGQEPLPDWDEEERLRQSLAVVQAEKIKLEREYESLVCSVVHLARGAANSQSTPPSPSGEDSGADIVLEFDSPVPDPAHLGAAARHALEEIKNKQRDAQHSLADQEHQIRLLKESSKLQRIRRTSGW